MWRAAQLQLWLISLSSIVLSQSTTVFCYLCQIRFKFNLQRGVIMFESTADHLRYEKGNHEKSLTMICMLQLCATPLLVTAAKNGNVNLLRRQASTILEMLCRDWNILQDCWNQFLGHKLEDRGDEESQNWEMRKKAHFFLLRPDVMWRPSSSHS